MKKQGDITLKEALVFLGCLAGVSLFAFFVGIPLIAVFLLFICAAYLKILSLKFEEKKYNFLSLSLLFLFGVGMIEMIRQHEQLSCYLIPVAAVTMLVALLYRDLELSLIFSLLLSVFAGVMFNGDLYLAIVLMIGGITGSLFVWQARRRSTIVTAGFCVGIVQALCVLLYFNYFGIHSGPLSKIFGVPFLNGFISSFLVAGLLPVFEFLFKVVTNISLLELADFNHPLLKRLVLEAPGTYHHSLMVGNLAEMAAEEVGANSLLARVGSYYHDIGKLEKPEYFSENQDKCLSKHDHLSASMSKLVIMDHVKSGVELAKKNRLNDAIIDFITQHHGTSLVYYFYRRALEATETKEDVKEEVFRYPGPKPQTKETAIVLLADSVEAACRALDEATAERISDMVHRIINNKFIDGQLDLCDLTLRDLEKIATVFIHILGAFYHSRIDYPDQNKSKGESN
ncbi:MAG: HDIG domain-containing metalloprotein [Candidatus Omnitrophota bacterium]